MKQVPVITYTISALDSHSLGSFSRFRTLYMSSYDKTNAACNYCKNNNKLEEGHRYKPDLE